MPSRLKRVHHAAVIGLALCALLQGCDKKPDAAPDTTPAATPTAAPTAAPTKTATDTPVLSVPIQRDSHWIVEAHGADNKPYRVLLDTGATHNILGDQGPLAAAPLTRESEAAFVRRGVMDEPTKDGTVGVTTATDPARFKLGLSPALRIQGWSMPAGALAITTDIARLAATDDKPFDAIVGLESMRGLTWRADYVAGQLTAYAGEAPAHEWQQCAFMTVGTEQRIPVIQLNLGDESNYFGVDTGSAGEVDVPQDIFNGLARAKHFDGLSTTFSYDATTRFVPSQSGILANLGIGPTKLPKLTVNGASSSLRIGLGVLQKMDRFEMDFRHYRFCFDLPATPRDSVLSKVGAALLRSGDHYKVAAIAPDGRLAASGIKLGDEIAKVDQTPVSSLDELRLYDLLNMPATHSVTAQRGDKTLVVNLKPL
ncbi:PDZ domain-containing protein [Paraburkholderia bannensis]|uniref:PDZ domain-containing protein n=1 Tax=Paraburkholderia bannensis TaxID=765414 RepID=UPI002ABD59DB|nr:PDZ domain-containing protein [Paraburkholderia bannensis]